MNAIPENAASESSTPQKVSVIVLTYNWPEALQRVLASIAAQTRLPDEVIVADDGSTDATRTMLEHVAVGYPVPLRHVWQPDQGFRAARARNRGIAASRGDYVLLLDGDMLLHPQFIADHLDFAERGFFLQGGRIKATSAETTRLLAGRPPVFAPWSPADFNTFDGIRRLYAWRQPWLARWKTRNGRGGRVMSCNMSFWRSDLLACNGFDERMEGYGAEDLELVARLQNAGLKRRPLKFAALAVHLEHGSRADPERDDPNLPNNVLLRQTREQGFTRCAKGINEHLAEFAEPPPDLRAQPGS